jgi:hypothetical protein
MADGTPTVNYGWIKPNVGASADVWGGEMNANLDGIDATVYALASSGDNRIINGDMRIDQRGVASGSGGTANGYMQDRWRYTGSVAGVILWGTANTLDPPFPYFWFGATQTVRTPVATDYFAIIQSIEADMISDFCWSGPSGNARSITLSFWAQTTNGGTFSGAIQNYAQTRSYPFTFTTEAFELVYFSITIPPDPAGGWVMNGAVGSMNVVFDIGSGANFRAPANAWAAGNYYGATGTTQLSLSGGAQLYITGVKLEIGSVATPFNRQSLAKSLADCQRYYNVLTSIYVYGYSDGSQAIGSPVTFPTMRVVPTATITAGPAPGAGPPGVTPVTVSVANIYARPATVTVGPCSFVVNSITLSAEL